MTLTDLASIGSFLSGVAVVITFIFLMIQMRQATRQTTSSAMGTWLGDYNNMLLRIGNDAEFALLMRKGLTDFGGLTHNDQMRFHLFMSQINLNAIYLFKQRNQGAFEKEMAEQILGFTATMFKMTGGRQWWDSMRRFTAPDFLAHMDKLIDASPAADGVMPWFSSRATDTHASGNEP